MKMREKTLFVAVIGWIILLAPSCTKSVDPGESSGTESIYPLAVGNMWIYRHEEFDSTGNLASASTDTTRVFGDTLINNERWYFFFEGSQSFYTNRSDGEYSYVRAWSAQPFLNLKFPGSPGESYAIPYALGSIQIVATEINATVPAGSFACYQYRISFPNDWQNDYYYAPGVGMVMSAGVRKHPGGSVYRTTRLLLLNASLH